jgi:hypothetical protein
LENRLIPRPKLDAVTEQDILNLIDHGVREGRTLDYKRDWPSDRDRERVAAFPPGNAAPEEPYVRAFPAYGSRTTLSVSLTPVVSIRHTAFADVTSLIHLIIEAKGAEP